MGKNKTNCEEDEINGVKRKLNKRKAARDVEEKEDEEDRGEDDNRRKIRKKDVVEPETEPYAGEEESAEPPPEDPKHIGAAVRVSGKGRRQKNHYAAFEYNGFQFDLDDPVLIVPVETKQKPRVAIIKDIPKSRKGSMMVAGQWFYRPEETDIRTGANWPSRDSRELFYSFHLNKIPAESVMHRCVVHFIPLSKQIPIRSQHPGFFVQRIYDKQQMNLFKLSENDYEEGRQHEIDLLVQKTFSRLGDLPDIESKDAATGQEDHLTKSKHLLREKSIPSLDVPVRDPRSCQPPGAETPGTSADNTSQYFKILSEFSALTGEKHRDQWLEKLLLATQFMSNPGGSREIDGKENGVSDASGLSSKTVNVFRQSGLEGDVKFCWPDTAVTVVAAVEMAAYEALSSNIKKYNKKMCQLSLYFKNNVQLVQQLLNGELEASQILTMSPKELKEGMTVDEIKSAAA